MAASTPGKRPAIEPSPAAPRPFLFGTANSDHQCEAYDPRWPDIWDLWEERLGMVPRGQATDFWNRYREDLELAQRMGCRAFRFSIAWSRVEPAPGEFSEEAFEHYRELIAAMRAAGMEPIVTLHHWTWPIHVEERGGMIADDFPEWFRRYAAEVARRLGEGVRYWVTINEPNALPFGYLKFAWQRHYPMPPGLESASATQQADAVARLMRNLFRAHAAAREAIREVLPEAQVGSNPCVLGMPEWFQRWFDYRLTHVKSQTDWARREERAVEPGPLETTGADVVLATLSMTPQRERQVLFSEPYFLDSMALLAPAGSAADDLHELDGARVAVLRGSTAEGALHALLPGARRLRVRDYGAALRALDEGRADAFLAGEALLAGVAPQHPERFRLLETPLPRRRYAAAVAQGDTDLLDAVDAAIRHFKETGAWAESFARHFPGADAPEPPRVARRTSLRSGSGETFLGANGAATSPAREGSRLRDVRRRGRLCVAVNEDAPGFSSRDPATSELRGLEIDLGRAIAGGIFGDPDCVEFRTVRTARRIPLLRSLLRAVPELLTKLSTFSTLSNTNWWHLGMAGKLPPFLCPPECVGRQDFVGLDYYWGIDTLRLPKVFQLIGAMQQKFSQAPVWPGGLYAALKHHARLFPGKELLVMENGCPAGVDGTPRDVYLRRHLAQVLRARRRGIPVVGYMLWCVTSCREWGLPWEPGSDFGVYEIDLDGDPALERKRTSSVEVYSELVRRYSEILDAPIRRRKAEG